MNITLNGEERQVEAGANVAALLKSLNLHTGKVAVERNLCIVPRSQYGETVLEEGDKIEIVRFIGGG